MAAAVEVEMTARVRPSHGTLVMAPAALSSLLRCLQRQEQEQGREREEAAQLGAVETGQGRAARREQSRGGVRDAE